MADQAQAGSDGEPHATPTCSRMYSQNQESYRMPDRIKIRQILLKTAEQAGGRRRQDQGQGRETC